MLILSIETSCDESAVALVKENQGGFFVIDELISSQIKTHAPFGGVVPNLASREHLKNLPILLKKIISRNCLKQKDVDLLAVTQGPGLIPALLIGTNAAKALAFAWKKPLIGVNHIEGHIYANLINDGKNSRRGQGSLKAAKGKIEFPVLALIVSGGHTELILMEKHLNYKVIGKTLDDAAGEAFDKAAKILGLGYPGGPVVSRLADCRDTRFSRIGNAQPKQLFSLPRPMLGSKNLDFSFSGLKTALLYTVRDNQKILKSEKLLKEICFEFQQAIIDVLVHKTIQAVKNNSPKTVLLGGGVSANKELRSQLAKALKDYAPAAAYSLPLPKYSADNASMIAIAGYYRWKFAKKKKTFFSNWKNLEADANLKLMRT